MGVGEHGEIRENEQRMVIFIWVVLWISQYCTPHASHHEMEHCDWLVVGSFSFSYLLFNFAKKSQNEIVQKITPLFLFLRKKEGE